MNNLERKRILDIEVKNAIRQVNNISKASAQDVVRELSRAKDEINLIILKAQRFEMPYYQGLSREINSKINVFEEKFIKSTTAGVKQSFYNGEKLTDNIFAKVGVLYTTPLLSNELLVATTKLSAEMVKDMADEMKRDIAKSLKRSILTGDDAFKSARKLDDIIGVSKKTGYQNRADVIARQEIGRTYNFARQAKDEQTAEVIPGYQKQWHTAGDGRVRNRDMGKAYGFISHMAAEGQIRNVDEPFDVGGEKLMFPKDPAGSAQNVVGCRCGSWPFMKQWEGK